MRRHWGVLAALAALAVVTVILAGLAMWRARTGPAEAVAAVPMGTPAVAPSVDDQAPPPEEAGEPTPTVIPTPGSTPTPDRAATPGRTAEPTVRAAPLSGGTLVVIGDGYLADASWPEAVASEFGMRVDNMAQSGMGYRTVPRWCDAAPCTSIQGSVAKIAAADPAVVVLAAGEADGDQQLAESAAATLRQLRSTLPNATIVVMSPFSERASRPTWLERHADQLEEAASGAGATWLDATFITNGSGAFEGGNLTSQANLQIATALERALK